MGIEVIFLENYNKSNKKIQELNWEALNHGGVILLKQIVNLVAQQTEYLVKTRRDIHAHAETGWTEFYTASVVRQRLLELGYDVVCGKVACQPEARMGVPAKEVLQACMERAVQEGAEKNFVAEMAGGYTAVIGVMQFAKPGATVAIRFDMDCNDVEESMAHEHFPKKNHFASQHAGCMHACGHDCHTTSGLGLATVLAEIKNELCGTVKLIFQPAEEGTRGAKSIVATGVVDDVDYMLGAHVMKGSLDFASFDLRNLLATSKFDVEFTGVSAHAGASPEYGKNALMAAVAATSNVMSIPRHSGGASRINVGVLQAGTGRNVVPAHALMKVETRGLTTEINAYVRNFAYNIMQGAARMYDVQLKITEAGGAAGASNSSELVSKLQAVNKQTGIYKDVAEYVDIGASDDFSYYMERVQKLGGQAAYMIYGGVYKAVNHNSEFDVDEKALPKIVRFLSEAVVALLADSRQHK